MAYRRPAVTVTQEFSGLAPALAAFALPSCIIGPAFQLISNDDCGNYTGIIGSFNYASLPAGGVVDTAELDTESPFQVSQFPLKVTLQAVTVQVLATQTDGAATDALTFTTAATLTAVLAGDKLVIVGGPNAGSYGIRTVGTGTLGLTGELPDPLETAMSFSITRAVASYEVPTASVTASTTGVSLPSGLQASGLDILAGTVLVTYRALRNDMAAVVAEFSKLSDIQSAFGGLDQINPANPLAYGLQIALQNTVTPVNGLGLSNLATADEVLAHTGALDVLKMTDMYALAPLTQNAAIATMYKTHVEGMSLKSKERVALVGRKLLKILTMQDESSTGSLAANGQTFTDANAAFLENGVAAGMMIEIKSGNFAGRYKIGTVDSEIKVTLATAVDGVTSIQSPLTYEANRDMSKTEQANFLAGYSSAIGSRRVVNMWPDILKAPVGASLKEVEGFYGACAIAGLTTGLPTQQGFTNLSISGFLGSNHGSNYFDDDQLDLIAGGGTMILAQDGPEQPLYVRHQLTSDTSAIKFQEYSLTKNVDFASKLIRNNYKKFVGQYNIVPTTLDELRTNAKGIISFLAESTRLPKIGGVIRAGSLKQLIEDPTQIDTVKMRFKLDFPVPLNNIDIVVEA